MSHTQNGVRVGVGVLVCKDGKFLIQQRTGSHGADTWAPPGGSQEYGESFFDTAKREVKEETSLEVDNLRFGGVTNDFFEAEGKHNVTVWVLCDYVGGAPTILELHKCKAMKWCDFDTLPTPYFLSVQNMLESEFIEDIKQELAESKR